MKLNPCFILLGLAAATYSMPIDTIEVRDVGEKWNSATEWVKDHGASYAKAFYNAGKTAVQEQKSSGGFLHPTFTRRSVLAPATTSSPLPTSTLSPLARALPSVPEARALPILTARALPTPSPTASALSTSPPSIARRDGGGSSGEDVKNGLKEIGNGIGEAGSNAASAAEAPFKAAASSVKNAAAAVTSSVEQPFKAAATDVKDTVNGVKAGASDAVKGYKGAQTARDLSPTPTARAFPPSAARK